MYCRTISVQAKKCILLDSGQRIESSLSASIVPFHILRGKSSYIGSKGCTKICTVQNGEKKAASLIVTLTSSHHQPEEYSLPPRPPPHTMAPVLTEDFKKRAEAKLEVASAGEFFKSNSARLLPSFDRDDGSKEESTCNDDDGTNYYIIL